jgi:hypothetical protein
MYAIPIPKWQSLSAALRHIARLANDGKHSEDIESSLFAAFRDGTLEARALRCDDDSDAHNLETIPIAFWQSLEANDFHRFLNNDGNTTDYQWIGDETPRYRNAQIETSAIDKWLYADHLQKEVKQKEQLPPSIWSGIKEPLIPYRPTESKLISMSEVQNRLSSATNTYFWEDATQQLIIDALKTKKIVGVAIKGSEMYVLPPVFWEISYLSSFSVGAFNAFFAGVVDNMLDSDRIANLHTIHGWPIVIEEGSFKKWLQSLDINTRGASNKIGRSSSRNEIYSALSQISEKDLNSLRIEKRGLADKVAKMCGKEISDRNFSFKAVSRHITSYLATRDEDKTVA